MAVIGDVGQQSSLAHIEKASLRENQDEQSDILISKLEGILRSRGYIGRLHLGALS